MNHTELSNFIYSIANLLRGPYRPPQYRRVMLPMTVLRRLDCVLEPTKDKVLEACKVAADAGIDGEPRDGSDDEAVLLSVLKRGRQPHLSYFAFTTTPKHRTLKVFDEPGPDGQASFHLYSMRQAIEEGFIHDVLNSTVMKKELEGWFIDRMEGNDEVFRKVMGDESLRRMASDYLLRRIYDRARRLPRSGVPA